MSTPRGAIAPSIALPLILLLAAGPGLAEPTAPRPEVLGPVAVTGDALSLPDIWSGLLDDPEIDMLVVPDTEIAPDAPKAPEPDIIPVVRSSVAPDPLRASAFPNPSRGPVTVLARDAATVSVRVYDVSGRTLASLEGSGGEVVWDGHDAQGRPAPSGVYFARVRAEGTAAETVRIVRR